MILCGLIACALLLLIFLLTVPGLPEVTATNTSRAALRKQPLTFIFFCAIFSLPIGQLHAQTLTVLHNFTGAQDGGRPFAGLTMDAAGNLYGAAADGGLESCTSHQGFGCGTAFMLSRRNNWTFNLLYTFQGDNDGAYPIGGLTIGRDGRLYGTTAIGGGSGCGVGVLLGCGTVYKLRPPARFCANVLCPWSETVLYRFPGAAAGFFPEDAVTFDSAGNLYGTTNQGSISNGGGVVFELTPSGSGWTETVLHEFTAIGPDGSLPVGGVTFDFQGNLYGTASAGGTTQGGIVYQLVPAGSGPIFNPLYSFQFPNIIPYGGVIADRAGNLYGTTLNGSGAGSVFELVANGGSWRYQLLYALPGSIGDWGPTANLAMDAGGNLYGTTYNGGSSPNCNRGCGTIFKLTPSNGSGVYTLLHEFTGTEGALPWGGVIIDANGDLYGTTTLGGTYNEGVVWKLTP
jgi:uncharacterized repeat protein (TIGR03803 family)